MSDENALANEIAKNKTNKTKEKPLWELSDRKIKKFLSGLTYDETIELQKSLLATVPKDNKEKKAIENAQRLVAADVTTKKMSAPSGGGRITGETGESSSNNNKTGGNNNNNNNSNNNKTGGENSKVGQNTVASLEADLNENLKKQQKAADSLNNKELDEKKVGDYKHASWLSKLRGDAIDDNLEFNSPNWFLNEVKEIAPNDKAKRGFLITNHIFNTLGTGLGNIGATVQNNGGSGGGTIKDYNSYIDQYRQSKMNQVIANRKAKQDSMMQFQISALKEIGATEEEALKIQNRLRNGKFEGLYKRLNGEEQMLLQALLYYDNEGKIGDALLGDMIDRMINGDKVSAEDTITTLVTASGIDSAGTLVNNVRNFVNNPSEGIKKLLGIESPEERAARVGRLYK